jgi:hypothetical protein
LCLFITSVVGGALGTLMALSASPWYDGYAAIGMMPFGLTPTEDQTLAGLIMWVTGPGACGRRPAAGAPFVGGERSKPHGLIAPPILDGFSTKSPLDSHPLMGRRRPTEH